MYLCHSFAVKGSPFLVSKIKNQTAVKGLFATVERKKKKKNQLEMGA